MNATLEVSTGKKVCAVSKKRFITEKDEKGKWRVRDTHKDELLSPSYRQPGDAKGLAKVCEEHHREVMKRRASV
jgi:hypothetical protein